MQATSVLPLYNSHGSNNLCFIKGCDADPATEMAKVLKEFEAAASETKRSIPKVTRARRK